MHSSKLFNTKLATVAAFLHYLASEVEILAFFENKQRDMVLNFCICIYNFTKLAKFEVTSLIEKVTTTALHGVAKTLIDSRPLRNLAIAPEALNDYPNALADGRNIGVCTKQLFTKGDNGWLFFTRCSTSFVS